MEIVKFLDKTWQEIPEQDNPAMDMHHRHFKDGYRRPEEFVMIFKGSHPLITNVGIIVARVPLRGDITKMGVFWEPEVAILFAEALAR